MFFKNRTRTTLKIKQCLISAAPFKSRFLTIKRTTYFIVYYYYFEGDGINNSIFSDEALRLGKQFSDPFCGQPPPQPPVSPASTVTSEQVAAPTPRLDIGSISIGGGPAVSRAASPCTALVPMCMESGPQAQAPIILV